MCEALYPTLTTYVTASVTKPTVSSSTTKQINTNDSKSIVKDVVACLAIFNASYYQGSLETKTTNAFRLPQRCDTLGRSKEFRFAHNWDSGGGSTDPLGAEMGKCQMAAGMGVLDHPRAQVVLVVVVDKPVWPKGAVGASLRVCVCVCVCDKPVWPRTAVGVLC